MMYIGIFFIAIVYYWTTDSLPDYFSDNQNPNLSIKILVIIREMMCSDFKFDSNLC